MLSTPIATTYTNWHFSTSQDSAHPYLHIPVETDSRKEYTLHILKGHWSLLVFIDGESQGPPGQIKQDAYGGTFGDTSFSPVEKKMPVSIYLISFSNLKVG